MVVTDGLHRVTGDLTPDSKGDYLPHIVYFGKMSYRRTDGAYFIWWDAIDSWTISTILGTTTPVHWLRVDPNIEGEYQPGDEATGVATVTEI